MSFAKSSYVTWFPYGREACTWPSCSAWSLWERHSVPCSAGSSSATAPGVGPSTRLCALVVSCWCCWFVFLPLLAPRPELLHALFHLLSNRMGKATALRHWTELWWSDRYLDESRNKSTSSMSLESWPVCIMSRGFGWSIISTGSKVLMNWIPAEIERLSLSALGPTWRRFLLTQRPGAWGEHKSACPGRSLSDLGLLRE